MTASPHITTAIDTYAKAGVKFHDVLVWHLMHGLVLALPAFLWIGYFCQRGDMASPSPFELSDTLFITFMTGDIRKASDSLPSGVEFIAFERGFKSSHPPKCYPMAKFQKLIQ